MASTSSAQASIYFERQPPGSMLCAVNALNNLVQNGLYSAAELAAIGKQLDDLEAEQLGGAIGRETVARGQEGMNAELSNNFDDSGFFSQAVVDGALRIYGLRLASWASEEMQPLHNFPEHQMAFLVVRSGQDETEYAEPGPSLVCPAQVCQLCRALVLPRFAAATAQPSLNDVPRDDDPPGAARRL